MKKNRITGRLWLIIPVSAAILLCSGIKPMIVMSGSMEPAIKTGSVCFVDTHSSYRKIKRDDVITYNLLDAKVTHRVTGVTEEGLTTKGDANSSDDIGIVTEDNYYGRVLFHIPYAGYILWLAGCYPITAVAVPVFTAFFFYSLIMKAGVKGNERRT